MKHPPELVSQGGDSVCAFYLLNSCTDCKLIYLYKYLTQLYASFVCQFFALHRYRRGHGFKSRTGLKFFSGLIFTTA